MRNNMCLKRKILLHTQIKNKIYYMIMFYQNTYLYYDKVIKNDIFNYVIFINRINVYHIKME